MGDRLIIKISSKWNYEGLFTKWWK
jgi:hypothetical protein